MDARHLFAVVALALAACSSGPTSDSEELARCSALPEPGARKACIQSVRRDDVLAREGTGVGPPPCHPASTNPNRDQQPC